VASRSAVLDASAVVALAEGEPGADVVESVLAAATIPAPNWSEMLHAIQRRGGRPGDFGNRLKALGVLVEAVAEDDAVLAAHLATANPALSLGDRFCLAVAQRLQRPVYTADRAWATAETNAEVVLIR
jgi:ribonuclease VapC